MLKLAVIVPCASDLRIVSKALMFPFCAFCARYPIIPPAKVSPAPVGSMTFSAGYAGRAAIPSLWTMIAPCSPFLTTTKVGPILRMCFAAVTGFLVLVSSSASS